MKQFIKMPNTGLQPTSKPEIKVYETLTDYRTALANGEISLGEISSISGISDSEDVMLNFEELRSEINGIKKVIPDNASEDNQLVTESEISSGIEERVSTIESVIPSTTSTTNKLLNHDDVFNSSDPSSLSSKVSTLETDVGNNETAITNIQNVIDSTASAVNQVLSASSVNALIPTFTLSGTTLTIHLPA